MIWKIEICTSKVVKHTPMADTANNECHVRLEKDGKTLHIVFDCDVETFRHNQAKVLSDLATKLGIDEADLSIESVTHCSPPHPNSE